MMDRKKTAAVLGVMMTLLTACGSKTNQVIGEKSAPESSESKVTETTAAESVAETETETVQETTAQPESTAAATTKEPETTMAAPATTAALVTKAPETEPSAPKTEPPAARKTYADYYSNLLRRGCVELTVGGDKVQTEINMYVFEDLNCDGIKELVISYDPSDDPTYFYLMNIQQCFTIRNGEVVSQKPSVMQHTIEQYLAADGMGFIEVLYRPNGGGYSFGRDYALEWRYDELGELSYDDDYDRMKRDAQPYCGAEPVWRRCSDLSVLSEYVPE